MAASKPGSPMSRAPSGASAERSAVLTQAAVRIPSNLIAPLPRRVHSVRKGVGRMNRILVTMCLMVGFLLASCRLDYGMRMNRYQSPEAQGKPGAGGDG